jgi:hypothetical protein
MQIFSKSEGTERLAKLDVKFSDISWKDRYGNGPMSFAIPADTGKKTALAKLLADLVTTDSEVILWITGYGIWPSSENMALFDGYRGSLGEKRSVGEAPVHLFVNSEAKKVECVLALALYFFWDAFLLNHSGGVLIELSHDEILDVRVRDKRLLEELRMRFDRFGLQQASNTV